MTVWHEPTEIPSGVDECAFFVVTVRRGHNGKVYTFPATYNCAPGNGHKPGWFVATQSEINGNVLFCHLLLDGDEFLGWCELPKWEDKP
jgi:hypothetical protein